MKKILALAWVLALSCNSSQKTVADNAVAKKAVEPSEYAASITEEELKEHLFTYASDEFEGRETGKPGQKKAIAYLKKQYELLGIPLPSGSVVLDNTEFNVGESVLTFSSIEGLFEEVVYASYGIEDGAYSDYNGLDVTGKLVLIKSGEPKNEDGTFVLTGSTEKSNWGNGLQSLGKRMEIAGNKGARGVIYYDDGNFGRFKSRFDYMKNNDSGNISLKSNEADEFAGLYVNAAFAKAILPEIDADNNAKLINKTIQFKVTGSSDEVVSENVAAIIKGSKKPNEYLVISSHLDHIGVTADGQINNGADDDGSGTVAMLEIAQAFKKAADAGNGPERSIVFLHVTGEEKGLLGSQYYTDVEPIFPLKNTVANLNIDMIGRIDPKREGERNYIYLIGSDKLSTELHELSEAINTKYMNIELDYTYNDENDPNRFYYRSDHYNFAKNNIPIIFYFNGTHADYHKPGDTPDKINYDLLQNRSRLIFHTAWEVANRPEKVVVDKPTK